MDKNDKDINITLINPPRELNNLEKTAIMKFKFEEKQEKFSRTKELQLLNAKRSNNDMDLPKIKSKDFDLPKKKVSLSDTIRIKINDLREQVEEKKVEKKSLYDTVIIKLDDLINNHGSLSRKKNKQRVVREIDANLDTKKHLLKKMKHINVNVDSLAYGENLYNLNKIALNNLSLIKAPSIRRYSGIYKLSKIDNIKVSRTSYRKYQEKLNKFAINKLYYKLAPKESNKYKLYKTSVTLSTLILFLTGAILINWFIEGHQINNLSQAIKQDVDVKEIEGTLYNVDEILESNTEPTDDNKENYMYWKYLNTPLSSINLDNLIKENSDTVGFVIVKNTNVSYPVVQTTNNDFYLTHDFEKNSNQAGWVFADYRNNFNDLNQNTVIYAHGRKDKVMFGSLVDALNPDWYNNIDNQIIQFSTRKYDTMWQIFSIYTVKSESYYITTDFNTSKDFDRWIDTMKKRSIHDFGININNDDKILTLSTCYNNNGVRLVIQAKLVKINQK